MTTQPPQIEIDAKKRLILNTSVGLQEDVDGVVIGNDELGYFSLPHEAKPILKWLAKGASVEELTFNCQQEFSEAFDLDELIGLMLEEGLVHPLETTQPTIANDAAADSSLRPGKTYHFEWISQGFAKKVFSPATFALWCVVVGLGIAVLVKDPGTRPSWQDFVFKENTTWFLFLLMALGVVDVFLHELAHLIAAKALGVSSKLQLSNRLWVLVAETDMSGVWRAKRSERYLPFLAGMMFDLAFVSLLLMAVYLLRLNGSLGPLSEQLLKALYFKVILSVVWQFCFHVRTDLYYVFTNYFSCKNLMDDTWTFIKNLAKKAAGKPLHDMSAIPEREFRVIRFYSVFWLIGRLLSFAVLFTVGLPTLVAYIGICWDKLRFGPMNLLFWEGLTLALLMIGIPAAGFFLWIKSMISAPQLKEMK